MGVACDIKYLKKKVKELCNKPDPTPVDLTELEECVAELKRLNSPKTCYETCQLALGPNSASYRRVGTFGGGDNIQSAGMGAFTGSNPNWNNQPWLGNGQGAITATSGGSHFYDRSGGRATKERLSYEAYLYIPDECVQAVTQLRFLSIGQQFAQVRISPAGGDLSTSSTVGSVGYLNAPVNRTIGAANVNQNEVYGILAYSLDRQDNADIRIQYYDGSTWRTLPHAWIYPSLEDAQSAETIEALWCVQGGIGTNDVDERRLTEAEIKAITPFSVVVNCALDPLVEEKLSKPISIYRLSERVEGVRNREWHNTEPAGTVANSTTVIGRAFRLSHDFTLPTTTATTLTNLNLNDTNNTAGLLDIQVLDTVIKVPTGGVWVRYTGGSEGYWAIEVGLCCGPLEIRAELGYTDRLDNTALVGPVFLPEGQHNFRAWNIDTGGSNSSHTVSYSTDGVNFAVALPAGAELNLEKRIVECDLIPFCDEVPEGWSTCYPKLCGTGPVDPLPETPLEVPKASSQLPIADNEVDTAIRTGQIGTSDDFAREDHNHPIRRQANPGDPTITFVGNAGSTLFSTVILDRWSDEESYSYRIRCGCRINAGTGWNQLRIPTKAGFQQPKIDGLGTYRTTSNSPQNDSTDGAENTGASPRGPFMGQEVHHWSSTNILYFAHFRRENNYTKYVEFTVNYKRV